MKPARALRVLGISPVHPRMPEESRIEMRLMPEDRRTDQLDVYLLTETQALELAENALTTVRIMRDIRESKARLAEADRLDRAARG